MFGRLRLVTLALCFCVSSITCGSSPTAPGDPLALDGTWIGSVTPDGGGAGMATVVLTQFGAGVSGTFSIASSPGSPLAASGTAGGTVSGTRIALFLTPSVPLACSPTLTLSGTIGATLTMGTDRLSGRYLITTCSGIQGGSVDLVLQ